MPVGQPPGVDSISALDAGLQVVWSDGHVSSYSTSELRRLLRRHGSELPEPISWDRDTLPAPPEVQFAALADASGTQTFAKQIHTYGFAVLRGVPLTTAASDAVGELLGAKWTTSMYGTNWEVKIEARSVGQDSAYGTDELMHHTDGNYLPHRAPMQLFHCFQPGAPGTGVSSIIDGFALAYELRRRSEKAYDVLTKQTLSYQYQDSKHDISAEHPVLQLNSRGDLVAVNWNNHDRATMPTDPDLIEAMRLWDTLLQEERWHLDFALQTGDLLVFDNLRLMHARKGPLDPGSPRHFVGFYLDNGVAGAIHKPRALQWAGDGTGPADLRSDTKTQPDGPMYTAMISATLGDDMLRECETTRALESYVAELLGKEAALLVSSGTQGNLLATAAQCPRGTEMVLGDESHMHLWEAGGPSVLFGIAQRTVPVDALGQLPLPALEASLALSDPEDDHCCRTRLVAAENSHGSRGGAVLSPSYMKELALLCRDRGLRLHVDGARLLNAAAAVAEASSGDRGQEAAAVGGPLGEAARQLLDGVDTVSLCLSKGLGCPGGAVIAGDAATIAECRRLRKLVGGSVRQASGLLAAAGLHVMRERDLFSDLRRDHALMRRLVEGIRRLPGASVDLYGGTNMAVVGLSPVGSSATADDRAARVADLAKASGLQVDSYLGQGGWRFVTHRGVQEQDVDALVEAFARGTA